MATVCETLFLDCFRQEMKKTTNFLKRFLTDDNNSSFKNAQHTLLDSV